MASSAGAVFTRDPDSLGLRACVERSSFLTISLEHTLVSSFGRNEVGRVRAIFKHGALIAPSELGSRPIRAFHLIDGGSFFVREIGSTFICSCLAALAWQMEFCFE